MCGISLIVQAVDAVRSEQQTIGNSLPLDGRVLLGRRGPDCYGELQVITPSGQVQDEDSTSALNYLFAASLLQLRGVAPTKVPLTDPSRGDVLCFNGEIFGGLEVPTGSNDGQALFQALCSTPDVPLLLSRLRGPWSIIYWRNETQTCWFGRDVMGRRSLLVHYPQDSKDRFIVSSVAYSNNNDNSITANLNTPDDTLDSQIPSSTFSSLKEQKLTSKSCVASTSSLGDGEGEGEDDDSSPDPSAYWQELPPGVYSLTRVRTSMPTDLHQGEHNDQGQLEEMSWRMINEDAHARVPQSNAAVPLSENVQSVTTIGQTQTQTQTQLPWGLSLRHHEWLDRFILRLKTYKRSTEQSSYHCPQREQGQGPTEDTLTVRVENLTLAPSNAPETHHDPVAMHTLEKHSCGIRNNRETCGLIMMEEPLGINRTRMVIPGDSKDSHHQTPGGRSDLDSIAGNPCVIWDPKSAAEALLMTLQAAVEVRCKSIDKAQTLVYDSHPVTELTHVASAGAEPIISHPSIMILFSGGVDSVLLAALSHRSLPLNCCIDLCNVCFDNGRSPDRVAAHSALKELAAMAPERCWRLVEVDATLEDTDTHREHLLSLLHPAGTIMDLNIGAALWLAASGRGKLRLLQHHTKGHGLEELGSEVQPEVRLLTPSQVQSEVQLLTPSQAQSEAQLLTPSQCASNTSGVFAVGGSASPDNALHSNNDRSSHDGNGNLYCSPARVVLLGHGADEQCAGYGRHRTRFRHGGPEALSSELCLDMKRMWQRNCGRDDRLVADNGREGRHPFLDEHVMDLILSLPLNCIADLRQAPGLGDKRILRQVLVMLGLPEASRRVKRAIQFGSRIGKLSNRREFGSNRAANKLNAGSLALSQIPGRKDS